ncbi:MAG: glutathione S-transferase [Candidatus Puniceispirillum sp.]|nr:glutathione S-transferase [Candidatus Puniceispirillum sp.]MBL6774664.1 glutathione S-transferase [Candidatus Puniceispirillum sp.]
MPTFWSFRRCPYAMRARLAIAASGEVVRLREILLRNKPEAFLSASPKGTVPVLVLADGTVIDESRDVMFWVLGRNDPDGWLTIWRQDPQRVTAFLDRLDGPFKDDLDRYKYASRYAGADAKAHQASGAGFLHELDKALEQTGALSGTNLGILDFASLPFVRQFRIANPDWFDAQPWPHLSVWLQAFLDSARFQQIMEKYPQWNEGASPIIFPTPG